MMTSTSPVKRPRTEPPPVFSTISSQKLLLSIPSLVLHPPTHKRHHQSVALAQNALRRCLKLQGLDPVDACRAWTGLAELGMGRLAIGIRNVEGEVEKALTKALLFANKNPALRHFAPHLTILSARLAQFYQNNPRFAQHTLRKLVLSVMPSKHPPNVIFSAHLALIRSLSTDAEIFSFPASHTNSPALTKCLGAIQDLHRLAEGHSLLSLLALVLRLQLLIRQGVWTKVPEALAAAEEAFASYNSSYPSLPSPPSTPGIQQSTNPPIPPSLHIHFLLLSALAHTHLGDAATAWEKAQALHAFVDGGALTEHHSTHGGAIQISFGQTTSKTQCHPLYIAGTHPRVLYVLTCLVSAAAKRDGVGRKPKKKVFAKEGLTAVSAEIEPETSESLSTVPRLPSSLNDERAASETQEREEGVHWGVIEGKEVALPREATLEDVANVKRRMVLMKADLLAEVVTVCIMRSEFNEAESALNELTSHLRTHALFPSYAARITLMNAQLAHALGRAGRARRCYEVAGWLAAGGACGRGKVKEDRERDVYERDEWTRVAARAGEVWVRIGVLRMKMAEKRRAGDGGAVAAGDGDGDGDGDVGMRDAKEEDGHALRGDGEGEDEHELRELRMMGKEVVEECRGMGGSLSAVGEVISACLCDEIWGSKLHLRQALDLATRGGDNHLRALVLALSASHYLHTAREHAVTILGTCDQIAAGLGAGDKHPRPAPGAGSQSQSQSQRAADMGGIGPEGMGNLRLRVWIGERLLEIHRSGGVIVRTEAQEEINRMLRDALSRVDARGRERWR